MKSNKATLILKKSDKQFKLFKIIFHSDGSYFITAPYHTGNSAFLFKVNFDFRKHIQTIPLNETLEKMELDDEEQALKISHHPDGFLQFSGKYIKSGRNADGSPKGIGIQSWTHDNPAKGPSWGISIKNINFLKEANKITRENLIVDASTIVDGMECDDVLIEGFFIPMRFAPYIFLENGNEFISITHPVAINLKLYVVRADSVERCKGFFGIHIQSTKLIFDGNESGFVFSTSSGNIEMNGEELIKGTCMFAAYPNEFKKYLFPSLNWNVFYKPKPH
ncbi:MAG: hypothetical protein EHM47_12685 [Ignavibacteriales bacterium]|nr:MAG: hypothetical protein EHM47_12685 [Ignavibacteriales bacterium]